MIRLEDTTYCEGFSVSTTECGKVTGYITYYQLDYQYEVCDSVGSESKSE